MIWMVPNVQEIRIFSVILVRIFNICWSDIMSMWQVRRLLGKCHIGLIYSQVSARNSTSWRNNLFQNGRII